LEAIEAGYYQASNLFIKADALTSTVACTVASTNQQPKKAAEPEKAVSAKTFH